MDANSLGKLRIDLTKSKCRSLRITFVATLTKDVAVNLGYSPKSSRFKTFYEQYTRNDTKHNTVLRIVRRLEQEDTYAIRLYYEVIDPVSKGLGTRIGIPFRTKKDIKCSDAFSYLCNIKVDLLYRCDCIFSYAKEDDIVPFVLPVEAGNKIFDEIRGIRFVKLDNEKILWENSIDLPEIDRMTHRVKFAIDSKCNFDLPRTLLKRAREISRKTFS